MTDRRKSFTICSFIIVFCIIMAFVDGVFKANYFIKSSIKLVLFLVFPLVYGAFDKTLALKRLFKPEKKGLLFALALAIGVYVVILGAYLLLKDVFDFSKITGALTENIGVTGKNFIFVSVYISL